MTDEQRSHDFALEVMKMYFTANANNFEKDNNGTTSIPVVDLLNIYNSAYSLMIESLTSDTSQL